MVFCIDAYTNVPILSFGNNYFTDNPESQKKSRHHSSHLYEGDIKLSEEQRFNNALFGNPDGSPGRAATNVDKIKWPNAVIPYEFDCSVGEYVLPRRASIN